MARKSKDKIGAMHKAHGRLPGKRCEECCNFQFWDVNDKTRSKCTAYGLSHSEATDWSCRHEACGHFDIPFDSSKFKPMYKMMRWGDDVKAPDVLDGQIGLF